MTGIFEHDSRKPLRWEEEEAPTGIFMGPLGGSAGGGDGLSLISLPEGLRRGPQPVIPDLVGDAAPLAGLLGRLRTALEEYRPGAPPAGFDLSSLSAPNLAILDQILGEGEVGIVVVGHTEYQVQESTLTGVWRVRGTGPDGRLSVNRIEVADVPSCVRAAEAGQARQVPVPTTAPPGTMNALPLLAEIAHHAATARLGEPNHIISFTLLPVNEADMALLKHTLGLGPVQAVSGGYGTCRVTATACRRVWSVQYLNARDTIILDTLEIGDVPTVLCAAAEDFEDSAVRLGEILEAYTP